MSRFEKETPIEREIRLVREREDELRRAKKNSTTSLDPLYQKSVSNATKIDFYNKTPRIVGQQDII